MGESRLSDRELSPVSEDMEGGMTCTAHGGQVSMRKSEKKLAIIIIF